MCIKKININTDKCKGCTKECEPGYIFSHKINKYIPAINGKEILFHKDEYGRISETGIYNNSNMALHIINICATKKNNLKKGNNMFEKLFKDLSETPTCNGCELHCYLGTKWSFFRYCPTLNCHILGHTKYKTKEEALKATYEYTQKCCKHRTYQK